MASGRPRLNVPAAPPAPMRVLFFNEGNLGSHVMGQGQLVHALRTGLSEAPDTEARFAGLGDMGRLARVVATRPVPVLAERELDMRPLRWYLVQSLRARAAVEAELHAWPVDVLHVHSQSVALAMAGRMARTPTALSVDTTMRQWSQMPAWRSAHPGGEMLQRPNRVLERRAYERAAVVLAWTGWAARGVLDAAPRAHVAEHHPGLDLQLYRPAPRRPRERPRVLFVGGRFREKGGEDLLAALGEGLGAQAEVDLVTPAAVPPRPGVRVHRLGPSDPALIELYQQADVLCLPSYGDAAPWAVLEAMACGTAVLASRVGGIPDLLEDGRAGVLVPVGAQRELGEALRALLADGQRRSELGARARERCERCYDARRQVPRLLDLLRAARGAQPR